MMKWIKIGIVLLVLGGISFGSSYFMSSRSARQAVAAGPSTQPKPVEPGELQSAIPDQPKEEQLDGLVKELRQKLEECRKRQEELDQREQRLSTAQESLRKRAEELEALQVKLAAPLTALKEAQADFKKNQVLVTQQEKVNLKRTALIYEKMDPAKSARIITDMCGGSQEDDAAKILFYMTDRAAAKLLAEISDKGLAARLCERFKNVREEN